MVNIHQDWYKIPIAILYMKKMTFEAKLKSVKILILFFNFYLSHNTINNDFGYILNAVAAIVIQPLHNYCGYTWKVKFHNVCTLVFGKFESRKHGIEYIIKHFLINSIKIHCLLGPSEVSRAQQSRICWAIPPEQRQVIASSTDYDQKVGFVNLGGNIHHIRLCPSDSFSERPIYPLVVNGAGMKEGSAAIPICSVSSSATWAI